MKRTAKVLICSMLTMILLSLTACGDTAEPSDAVPVQPEAAPTETVLNNPQEGIAQPTLAEVEPGADAASEGAGEIFEPLPIGPQGVTFTSADGRTLEGLYYPANTADAPVVVLMHWAPGSMQDWAAIAPWLQNRSDELDGAESWFPPMPAEASFAVLVFNFGNYGISEYGGSWESYVEDALAAVEFAASLNGVDPHRVVTIGASIGADGAVDGCYLFNDTGEGGSCMGALSLSPGNYLTQTFTYAEAADMINQAGFPVWCLAAEKDYESPDVCRSVPEEANRVFIFPGGAHGMALVSPELYPDEPLLDLNTMQIIQEFLEMALGIPLNDFDLP